MEWTGSMVQVLVALVGETAVALMAGVVLLGFGFIVRLFVATNNGKTKIVLFTSGRPTAAARVGEAS
jgi:hypothetical protein